MDVVKAPGPYGESRRPWLFLAGSIEMGKAEDWQRVVTDGLQGVVGTVLNPRRDDWDSSWRQERDCEPFRPQVEWELGALEAADLVALYLAPGTQSPISLLELGLFRRRELYVCCPQGFWRKGNVDIVCDRYRIVQAPTLEALVGLCRLRLTGRLRPLKRR